MVPPPLGCSRYGLVLYLFCQGKETVGSAFGLLALFGVIAH